jgi:hypothetical protein
MKYMHQSTEHITAMHTLATSNPITGIFFELGSIKWRRNRGAPKVRESISSEATAYTIYDTK